MILGGAVIGNGDLHTGDLRSETELSKPQLITTGDRGAFLGSNHDAKCGCLFSLNYFKSPCHTASDRGRYKDGGVYEDNIFWNQICII